MNIFKGELHMKDGVYFVKLLDQFIKVDGKDEIPLCDDDQLERKQYLKESMSMIGEIVEFEIRKVFFAKNTGYTAKLIWPEEKYTVDDVLAAAQYGYDYRETSKIYGEVPVGNVLQWLMHRKELTIIPKNWVKYKQLQ